MITEEQASKAKEIVSGFDDEKKKSFLDKYNALDSSKKEVVIGRLLSDVNLGTITATKPLDKNVKFDSDITSRLSEVDTAVKGRGDYLDSISSDMNSPNPLRKGLGVLKTAGIPAVALQSGLSNPMLAMQRGNFNPVDLAKEAYLGATLQKQGEYGDVYRGAIPNKTVGNVVGATAGLGLSIAGPIQAFKALKNTFGDVSKMSDKLVKDAGQKIIQSSELAEQHVGEAIGKAYSKLDGELVDGNSWTRTLSSIPKPVKDEITRTIGDVDTLPNTLGNLRQIKTLLGKYKPGSFGKEARGLSENIEIEKLDDAYTGIKSLVTNTVAKKIGAKNASQLLDLDETASQVYRATSELKNASMNPRLLLPTRAGKVAKGLEETGDVSTREAMNIIRRGGGKQAKKLMNKAIRSLEIFNSREAAWKTAGHIVGAATYGGAIGAVGGGLMSKILNRDSSE